MQRNPWPRIDTTRRMGSMHVLHGLRNSFFRATCEFRLTGCTLDRGPSEIPSGLGSCPSGFVGNVRRDTDANSGRRHSRRRYLIAALVTAALAGVALFATGSRATTSVDFSFLPSNPAPSDSVDFTITTDNSDVTGAHYVWDFGDTSSTVDTASTTVSHTFTSACHCDVTVTLEDGSDNVISSNDHTVVVNTPPTAAFTFTPTTPNPNDTVSFDGTGSSD